MKFLLLHILSLSGLTLHAAHGMGNDRRWASARVENDDHDDHDNNNNDHDEQGGGSGSDSSGDGGGDGPDIRWQIFDIVPPTVENPDESSPTPTPSTWSSAPIAPSSSTTHNPTPNLRSRPPAQSPPPVSQTPQSSFPSTLPPAPPVDPFEGPCDPNWNTTKTEFDTNLQSVWTNPNCYDFYLKRTCYCPYLSGANDPVLVRVRNGTVVEPLEEDGTTNVPTMAELLDRVYTQCIAKCPNRGAEVCQVTYGPWGNVQDLYYDITSLIADEEQQFTITNFTLCSSDLSG